MWIAVGSTPWSRITCRRSTTICCGPHRNHSSTSSAGQQRVEDPGQPVAVEAAGEQLDVLLLAGQHVDQPEPVREAVLQVVQVVEEHHRAVGPVRVDQHHLGARLALEDRGHDRDHRRDARAGRDRDVRLGGRRVERGGEPAGRRHHVELVTDVQRVDDALAEGTAGQLLHADPEQAGARRRADREAAALAVVAADRQVLAVHEAVVVGELGGHGEGERDRVVGQRLDGGHPERVELGLGHPLEGLEVVEGLAAGAADPQALAGGRAEPAGLPGVEAAALRAAHRQGERRPARPAGRPPAPAGRCRPGRAWPAPPRSRRRWTRPG